MFNFVVSVEDINLNSRVFLWPKDMEAVIDLAMQRLTMKRDQAEASLKTKRVNFEGKLKRHEKMLTNFKKKDPPILTMDEMEENVLLVEELMGLLEVGFNILVCLAARFRVSVDWHSFVNLVLVQFIKGI